LRANSEVARTRCAETLLKQRKVAANLTEFACFGAGPERAAAQALRVLGLPDFLLQNVLGTRARIA
jgi:hypothetical protein